jgi:hypothetical protein
MFYNINNLNYNCSSIDLKSILLNHNKYDTPIPLGSTIIEEIRLLINYSSEGGASSAYPSGLDGGSVGSPNPGGNGSNIPETYPNNPSVQKVDRRVLDLIYNKIQEQKYKNDSYLNRS